MPKFRKKPVVIEAVQWSGSNWHEIYAFAEHDVFISDQGTLNTITLEGPISASEGDWIIKGVQGEFYPCKPDIFEQTYEDVND